MAAGPHHPAWPPRSRVRRSADACGPSLAGKAILCPSSRSDTRQTPCSQDPSPRKGRSGATLWRSRAGRQRCLPQCESFAHRCCIKGTPLWRKRHRGCFRVRGRPIAWPCSRLCRPSGKDCHSRQKDAAVAVADSEKKDGVRGILSPAFPFFQPVPEAQRHPPPPEGGPCPTPPRVRGTAAPRRAPASRPAGRRRPPSGAHTARR
jgi:hypothetical protein